jgi:TIR domain
MVRRNTPKGRERGCVEQNCDFVIMVDIFLSYSQADSAIVRRIAESIEAHGFHSWWDRHLLPGQDFDREIEQKLQDAKCVVVVWSIHSVDSRWVRAEASEALDRRKLIPAQIDDCRIPLEFRRVQTAKLLGWKGDFSHHEFRQLISGIRSIASAGYTGVPLRARERTASWHVESKSFGWNYVRFTIVRAQTRHLIEYRNRLSYESICVNGTEVCKGGSALVFHSAFQFYVETASEPCTCIVEPVYNSLGRLLTARLLKLKITIDGNAPAEVTR